MIPAAKKKPSSRKTDQGPSWPPPPEDLPHMMLTMSHLYLLHASEAVRCTHSLGLAWYLLPTPLTHTPHFRHYYTFWCGRRWPQYMHTYADLSDMAQKQLTTAVSLHHLDYSFGDTVSLRSTSPLSRCSNFEYLLRNPPNPSPHASPIPLQPGLWL